MPVEASDGLQARYEERRIAQVEWRERLVADFYWMNQFEITHAWTLAAVALLVVDAVVVGLGRRRAG